MKLMAIGVLLICSLLLVNGCNDEENTPQDMATKEIGSTGGELKGSDGVITLNVPKGAMEEGTQVSIQKTEASAPKGVGKVYSLSPEGTQFKTPVELSFQYTDEDVKNIPISRLAIAFKKSDDSWQVMPTVKVDEATKTVTTQTNHFSQWSLIDGLPEITSFSPTSANDDVPTTVTITGTNFSSVVSENVVTLNDVSLTVVSVTGNQIIVVLPEGAASGAIKVVVNGNAAVSSSSFTVIGTTPTLASFSPTSAQEGITTTVSITGTNFSSTVSENVVSINGIQATVASATTSQLMVIFPGTITTGPIKVAVKGKVVQSVDSFIVVSSTPSITNFSPSSMNEGIITTVEISGTNFSSVPSENTVTLNGLAVLVVSVTSNQLVVIVPSNATTGTFAVTVNGKTGNSPSNFNVVSTPPAITGFSPTSAVAGLPTTVTINGTNFSSTVSDNQVSLNGIPLTVAAVNVSGSSSTMVVLVPGNVTTGRFQIVVKGKAVTASSDFTVVSSAPSITSFSPASTQEGIITNVTISGTNFSINPSENIVSINGVPVSVLTVAVFGANGIMTVVVPANVTTGKFQLSVNGQTVTAASDFNVISSAPSLASFSPASGASGTDISVMITGNNFSPVASENHVTINGLSVTVTSSTTTTLMVIIPGTASTGKILVEVNNKVVSSATNFVFN